MLHLSPLRRFSMRAVVAMFERYQHLDEQQVHNEAVTDTMTSQHEKALAAKMLARLGDWRRSLACVEGAYPTGCEAGKLDAVHSFLDDYPAAVAARIRAAAAHVKPLEPSATEAPEESFGGDDASADSGNDQNAVAATFSVLRDADLLQLATQPTGDEPMWRSTQTQLFQRLLASCLDGSAANRRRRGPVVPTSGMWALSLVLCHWAGSQRLRSAQFEATFVESMYQAGMWREALVQLASLPRTQVVPLFAAGDTQGSLSPETISAAGEEAGRSNAALHNGFIFADALRHTPDVIKTAVEQTSWMHALQVVLPVVLENTTPPSSASWVASWSGLTSVVASLRPPGLSDGRGNVATIQSLVRVLVGHIRQDALRSRAAGIVRDTARYTMIVDLLSGTMAARPDSMVFGGEVLELVRLLNDINVPATQELFLALMTILPFSTAVCQPRTAPTPAIVDPQPSSSSDVLALCERVMEVPVASRWAGALALLAHAGECFHPLPSELMSRYLSACARGTSADRFGYSRWEQALAGTESFLSLGIQPDQECYFFLIQFSGTRHWAQALSVYQSMRKANVHVKAGTARAVMFYMRGSSDWALTLRIFDAMRRETTMSLQPYVVAFRAATHGKWEAATRLLGDMCTTRVGLLTSTNLRVVVDALLDRPQDVHHCAQLFSAGLIDYKTRKAIAVLFVVLRGDREEFAVQTTDVRVVTPNDTRGERLAAFLHTMLEITWTHRFPTVYAVSKMFHELGMQREKDVFDNRVVPQFGDAAVQRLYMGPSTADFLGNRDNARGDRSRDAPSPSRSLEHAERQKTIAKQAEDLLDGLLGPKTSR